MEYIVSFKAVLQKPSLNTIFILFRVIWKQDLELLIQ
jgi:hypothetical protein